MINNKNSNFEALDAITLVSFAAQLDNMEKDGIQNEWIHKVVLAIANEIEKLHKENDIIMKKLDNITTFLEKRKDVL